MRRYPPYRFYPSGTCSSGGRRHVSTVANLFARAQRFEDSVGALRKWYVAERLEAALGAFYQNARGRVHIVVIPP